MLVHANFTKVIGPAKLFLNNRIIYLQQQKIVSFVIFVLMKLAKRSFKEITLEMPKKITKFIVIELDISVKLDLQSCPLIPYHIFIERYTWFIILEIK